MNEILNEIRQCIGKEQFELLMSMIKDERAYHESIGTVYTNETLIQSIENAFMVVKRVYKERKI